MKYIHWCVVFFMCLFLNACALQYHIQTKPDGAEVFYGKQSLGKTPIKIPLSDLDDTVAGGVLLRLEVSGYKRAWLWLPKLPNSYDIQFNLNPFYRRSLSASVMPQELSRLELNKITHSLLDLQTHLLLGQPIQEQKLEALLESNPTLGSAYFLKCLHLLRKNQTSEAVGYLKDALRYAPKEYDFMVLFNELNPQKGTL